MFESTGESAGCTRLNRHPVCHSDDFNLFIYSYNSIIIIFELVTIVVLSIVYMLPHFHQISAHPVWLLKVALNRSMHTVCILPALVR